MRHLEAGFQMAMRHQQYLIDAMLRMNNDLMRNYSSVVSENADALKLVKELILQQATSQSELRMKEMAFARNAQRESLLMKQLPALANTIAGREVFPQNSQDTALIEMMLEKFSEDQIKMMASTLSPEAQGLLAARASEFYKQKREAEDLARQAMNGKDPLTHELGESEVEHAASASE
jgi:hypothetical protein